MQVTLEQGMLKDKQMLEMEIPHLQYLLYHLARKRFGQHHQHPQHHRRPQHHRLNLHQCPLSDILLFLIQLKI